MSFGANRKLYPGDDRPNVIHSLASNIRRATECAQDGRYGKAVAALLSLGTCPMTKETLTEMKASILKRSCHTCNEAAHEELNLQPCGL